MPRSPLARLRGWLLALFVLGLAGTTGELILLGHYADPWQWTPLAVLGVGVAVTVWRVWTRGPAAVHGFRAVMALFILSGLVGLYLHHAGNAEFELELVPGLTGWALFREALTGATPALAPATMVHLGLLGWLSTWAALAPAVARPGE